MEIIHATWEKRNIGMDAFEISVTHDDCSDVHGVLDIFARQSFSHCLVTMRIPISHCNIVHALEEYGFRFIETQFILHKDRPRPYGLEDIPSNDIYEIQKNKQEWEKIIDMIDHLFHTDRISLDPVFGPDIGSRRYRNWCMDLCDKPSSSLHVLKKHGDIVAFWILDTDYDGHAVDYVLGGVLSPFQGKGYGKYLACDVWSMPDIDVLRTATSSNNLPALRTYLRQGFVINDEMYILRKIFI